MTSPRMALAFWNSVVDCLVQFFDVAPEEAKSMAARYRKGLFMRDLEKKRDYPDLIYHAEPIHVAGNLAHREVVYDSEFYKRYGAIQAHHIRLSKKRNSFVLKQLADLSQEQQSVFADLARHFPSYEAEDALILKVPKSQKQLVSG